MLKANNKWTLTEFARKAPGMDWNAFLQARASAAPHHGLASECRERAAALVSSEPLAAWKDFLAFQP